MNKIFSIIVALFLLSVFNSQAQDKHDYATPLGKTVFFRDVQDANRMSIGMNEIQPLSDGTTGLMVMFNLRADLSQINRPVKLLSFSTAGEDVSHLDIFYTNRTIMVRRRIEAGSPFYYDYDLYDPMFSIESGDVTWEIKVFFTGYYFWIETRNTQKLLANKWHAPIFFGIDLPNHHYMDMYLSRSSEGRLIFGDSNTDVVFTMPEEIAIHEFKYAELKDELQNNFCND